MKHPWSLVFVALTCCLTPKAQAADTAQESIPINW
jgi:hypothetical protein